MHVHDDVGVLVCFASPTGNNARTRKIAFQKKGVSEIKQQFGLFISISNTDLQIPAHKANRCEAY